MGNDVFQQFYKNGTQKTIKNGLDFPQANSAAKTSPLLEYIVSHFGHRPIVVCNEKKILGVPASAKKCSARFSAAAFPGQDVYQ